MEEVLYEHSKVQEAAVVGAPDAAGKQQVKAFVVLRAGAIVSIEELREHCLRRLDDGITRRIGFSADCLEQLSARC